MKQIKLGFYLEDDGCLWLVSPEDKVEFWSDYHNEWREWNGLKGAAISYVEHPTTEYIEGLHDDNSEESDGTTEDAA